MDEPADDHGTERPGGTAPPAVRPVDLRDYVAFSADGARRVRVFTGDGLALDVWGIEPGQSTPVLHHPGRDVSYTVLGGRSWFVTDAGEIGLDPMGAMLVRAGTVHAIDNRAPDPLVVVAVSAPPSDDPEDLAVAEDGTAVHHPRPGPGPLRRLLRGLLGADQDADPDPLARRR